MGVAAPADARFRAGENGRETANENNRARARALQTLCRDSREVSSPSLPPSLPRSLSRSLLRSPT